MFPVNLHNIFMNLFRDEQFIDLITKQVDERYVTEPKFKSAPRKYAS